MMIDTRSPTTPVRALALAVLLTSGIAAPASAQINRSSGPQAERPALLAQLVGCRAVTEAAARLACYDSAAGALDTAEKQGDVVVVDRAQVAIARRQMFGFELPSFNLFDRSDAAPVHIDSVETTLTRAIPAGNGQWLFTLADGSSWRQIDSERLNFRNRAGEPIHIRRAALGSYLLTVGSSQAARVRRQ